MSPYSPVNGYQFLYKNNKDKKEITNLLINHIESFAIKNKILSCNFLYVDAKWMKIAESQNCAKWINQQSILELNEEKSFSDFLKKFNSNQRRNIKRERESIKKCGVKVEPLSGSQINVMNLKKCIIFMNFIVQDGEYGEVNTSLNHFLLNLHQQNLKKILFYLMQKKKELIKQLECPYA